MNTINKRGNEVTFGLSDGNIIRCILNPDGQSIRVETVHIGTRPQAKRDSLLGHYTITVQTCD